MASATTDIGYWLLEATGDDPKGGFNTGEDVTKHIKPPIDHLIAAEHTPNLEPISENISNGESGDTGDIGENPIY